MVIRQVAGTITAGLLVCGLEAIAPASGWAQQGVDLPQERGPIMLWGCFQRQEIKDHERYVLVNPTLGTATSTQSATCTSSGTEQVIQLKDTKEHHLNKFLIGRYVEVDGILDRMEDANKPEEHVRAVHVKSFRQVPVEIPRYVENIPTPEIRMTEFPPAPPAVAQEAPSAPVGTTGYVEKLPHTASPLPLTGLIGLLALAGGLALHRVGRQRVLGRD
jgi:hypothetical protein